MSEAPLTDDRVPPDLKHSRRQKAGFSSEAPKAERLPVQSPEAEAGVLGCILLKPIDSMAECMSRFKSASVFYDLRNSLLYQTFVEMHEDEVPIDVITVHDRLKVLGKMDMVGGLAYIASLPDSVPSGENLLYYLEIVLEKYALRTMVQSCTDIIGRVYEHSADAASLVGILESEVLAMSSNLRSGGDVKMKEHVSVAIVNIEARYAANGARQGLPTGIPDLDRMIGGLQDSEMIIIAARPSMGKTSLAMNFVEVIAVDHKLPVGVISLEMNAGKLVERMLLSRSQVNSRDICEAAASRDFPRITGAAGKLSNAPIHIVDKRGLNIRQVKSEVRRLFYLYGIKMFVVDYIQRMQGSDARKSPQEQIKEVSNGLSDLCGELNIPGVILSQLNRDVEKDGGRAPRLSDLRQSGDIEQDADTVILLHKKEEEDSDPNNRDPYPCDLIIAKRRNGPTGYVHTTFIPQFTRFVPRAKVTDEDVPPEHQQQSFYPDQ